MKSQRGFPGFGFVLVLLITLNISCQPAATDQEAIQNKGTTQPAPSSTPDIDLTTEEREKMVSSQIKTRGVKDPQVLTAMETVPRHEFVPDQYLSQAYEDHPLPIGYGQTISQPFIVALMTEVLQLEKGDRVLEIGTGSGYQAAVLAEMETKVFTIEIIPELAGKAEQRLDKLGYTDIEVRYADGYYGWEEHAPFDAVIVTAAPDHLPLPLIQQLAEGGRLVIPIGPIGAVQTLWLFEKIEGELLAKNLGAVQFVPFTGNH
ncbi:MAG: protein-L-isoaspartate(D-aspartate) O-methyltransferase [Anaerolineales bacterium]|nr:protein-L-isoaspartate(D-aspartate) O-methyltransferase [Anaerolineales bacterium]